ncbi:MAG TPA: hypothetical protein VGJ60_16580 [Chloroflexota bacterium]|jgi:hypothetical protein
MTDRLAEIEQRYDTMLRGRYDYSDWIDFEDVPWLIAEVKRLRLLTEPCDECGLPQPMTVCPRIHGLPHDDED